MNIFLCFSGFGTVNQHRLELLWARNLECGFVIPAALQQGYNDFVHSHSCGCTDFFYIARYKPVDPVIIKITLLIRLALFVWWHQMFETLGVWCEYLHQTWE